MKKLKNQYSVTDKFILLYWLLRTKLINKNVRLFRFPIVIRGRKYIDFGMSLTTGVGCRFDCFSSKQTDEKTLVFGNNIQLNDYVHIVAMNKVKIGDNVLMASHVFISDNSHGSYKGDEQDSDPRIPPVEREYKSSPVTIGQNTWIGEGVVIMPGVSIGEGCVIGAHSIVNRDIPNYTVAVGAPIRIIKEYDFEAKSWIKINSKENV